jgi:hypothetical protein
MPIDPRIPLGVQPLQLPSPLEAVQTIAQIQGIREQTEARRLAAEAARQKAMDEAAIRRVMTEAGGDWEKALPQLRTINPSAAAKLETDIAETRNKTLEGLKTRHELASKQLGIGAQLLETVKDQQSLDVVLPMIATLSPEIAQQLGPTYDPARVEQFRQVGLTQKDLYDRKQDALKLLTDGKATEGLGTWLSTINPADPQAATQWDQALAGARAMGVPSAVLAQFGEYSPENVQRAASLTITPAKRVELAGQAETRAQTAAHQAATEAIARGQLDVSRGHLGVSQGQLRVAQQRLAQDIASGAAGGVKLTGAQQEDIATMLTVQELGDKATKLGNEIQWSGVGPIQGRTGPLGARWLGTGTAKEEELRNLVGNIQGTIAKLRGGTAFSAQEQAMLDRYTPTVTDPELVIKTKLKTLKDFIIAKRENTLRVASGQYAPRETSPAGTPTTGQRRPIPGIPGGEAEFRDGKWIRVK